jgi:hypothetical protein
LGAEIEFSGARMIGNEAFFFALVEALEFGAVDGANISTLFGISKGRAR